MRASRKMLDWRILGCLILCASFPACNDTDDVHVGLRTSAFDCSSASLSKTTPQDPDQVALTCGGEAGVDVREIHVVILGGKADNIKGLHFDVVYPRDRFAYVDGSVAMFADNFLTWGDGVCGVAIPRTCTDPPEKVGDNCNSDAQCNIAGVVTPVVTVVADLDTPTCDTSTSQCTAPPASVGNSCNTDADCGDPLIVDGRVRITIDRPMPAGGVGVMLGGTQKVLRFQLRTTSLTRPTDPTLLTFENAVAVDPANNPLDTDTVVFNDQLLLWVQ